MLRDRLSSKRRAFRRCCFFAYISVGHRGVYKDYPSTPWRYCIKEIEKNGALFTKGGLTGEQFDQFFSQSVANYFKSHANPEYFMLCSHAAPVSGQTAGQMDVP